MLSYRPGASNSGPVTIKDTLSANLTFVAPIKAESKWTWTTPPYPAGGNTKTYSHPGFGPGLSVTIDVPTGFAGTPTSNGDGFFPIPVGGDRLYGIYHHRDAGSAQIMCWLLSTLKPCPGNYPRSLGSDLMVPTIVRHVVVDDKIYFPAVREVSTTEYKPGIGCWDTNTQSPCAFTELVPKLAWTQKPHNKTVPPSQIAGIASHSSNPNHLFMFAVDQMAGTTDGRIYCIDIASGQDCPGWTTATSLIYANEIPIDWSDHALRSDILIDESRKDKFFVLHHKTITCLDITNGGGTVCGSVPAGENISLIPISDDNMILSMVCASHNYTIPGAYAPMACMDADTGVAAFPVAVMGVLSNGASAGAYVVSGFRVPGTTRVLYASRNNFYKIPLCVDYGKNPPVECPTTDFNPAWMGAFGKYSPLSPMDYGYAEDPLHPGECLLGLGDAGIPWRFGYDGSYNFSSADGCKNRFVKTIDIDEYFCAVKPTSAQWTDIVIRNPPPQLDSGTIKATNGSGQTQTVVFSDPNSVPSLSLDAAGVNRKLTVELFPHYTSAPANAYKIEVAFTSNVAPQICYQAKVKSCGVVSNAATIKGTNGGTAVNYSRTLNLGKAIGPACPPPEETCLGGTAQVVCGETPGTHMVTLKLGGAKSFVPSEVLIASLTSGVSIVQPASTYQVVNGQVTITIAGAGPGGTVKFRMDGVAKGKGSTKDTDLCCNGTITVELPANLPCHLSIVKNAPATCKHGEPCTFTITFTANNWPFNGDILLMDFLRGMSFIADWSVDSVQPPLACGSPPTIPFNCLVPLSLAAGAKRTYTVVLIPKWPPEARRGFHVENCAYGIVSVPAINDQHKNYTLQELNNAYGTTMRPYFIGGNCKQIDFAQ